MHSSLQREANGRRRRVADQSAQFELTLVVGDLDRGSRSTGEGALAANRQTEISFWMRKRETSLSLQRRAVTVSLNFGYNETFIEKFEYFSHIQRYLR